MGRIWRGGVWNFVCDYKYDLQSARSNANWIVFYSFRRLRHDNSFSRLKITTSFSMIYADDISDIFEFFNKKKR